MLFFLCLVKRTYVMNSFSLFCNILSSVLFVFSEHLQERMTLFYLLVFFLFFMLDKVCVHDNLERISLMLK